MQFSKANFHLFIRSGRGASLSQHGCLNLTIVSFLKLSLQFFEYRPLKVNFRMPLLRKLKIFPLFFTFLGLQRIKEIRFPRTWTFVLTGVVLSWPESVNELT
jgi:hypothetical protein